MVKSAKYAQGFQQSELTKYKGHREKAYSVAWCIDGKKLASSSGDKSVRLWSVDKQTPIDLKHNSTVYQVAWDPTQTECLVSLADQVYLWDTRSRTSSCFDIKGRSCCWKPDGSEIAVYSDEKVLFVDPRKGVVNEISTHANIHSMKWDYEGKLYLTDHLGRVYINDQTLEGHTADALCIDMDPKGRYFVTGGSDGLVCIWNIDELICTRTIDHLDYPIRSTCISWDGELIASASDVTLDITHLDGTSVYSHKFSGPINSIDFHPSKFYVAVASDHSDKYGHVFGHVTTLGFSRL